MPGHGGLKERLRFVAARPMPISFCVLINPWGRSTSLCVYARRQFNVRSVRGVASYVNGRFFRVYLVRNAVAKVASIDRRQLFGVSFRHKPAFFQRLLHGLLHGFQHCLGIILKVYIHRWKSYPPNRACSSCYSVHPYSSINRFFPCSLSVARSVTVRTNFTVLTSRIGSPSEPVEIAV